MKLAQTLAKYIDYVKAHKADELMRGHKEKQAFIKRPFLMQLIMRTLNIRNRLTVYSWITTLMSQGILKENPHHDSIGRATSATIYYINGQRLYTHMLQARSKEEKLLKKQLGLDSYFS